MKKNYDDMLSRFHLVPERNGRTDGQTDRQTDLLYQYRASVYWRAIKMAPFLRHSILFLRHLWDIAYNFSYFAIYIPNFIKIRGNLTKFWQKQKCSFLRHSVAWTNTPKRREQKRMELYAVVYSKAQQNLHITLGSVYRKTQPISDILKNRYRYRRRYSKYRKIPNTDN